MINPSKTLLLVLAGMTLLLGSCVSKKKYAEMENLKNRAQALLRDKNDELGRMQASNDSLSMQLNDCNDKVDDLEKQKNNLMGDLEERRAQVKSLTADLATLRDNHERLKEQSSSKMRDMIARLEELQADLKEREARLAEVEGRLNQRDSIMNALKGRIADALLGFQKDGLTVDIRNGKVYVSLSNKLLFASGSTKIDQNGQKALRELAKVLSSQEDVDIMVEGHTDDVPVANLGAIKDNWDLSVMRSTEVVRLLVANGVEATRVIPAGRGEYMPVAEGKTPEARAANRRTEIVISPQLDELFDLIDNK